MFSNHPANGFQEIGNIVSCSRQVVGRRRKRANGAAGAGCMLPVDPMTAMAIMRCCRAAARDEGVTAVPTDQLNAIVAALPMCPPTRAQMDLSTMFMRFTGQDEAGVSQCFRSNNGHDPPAPTQPVTFYTVCCYGNTG